MQAELVKKENGKVALVGEVNANNIVDILNQGEQFFSTLSSDICLDLIDLTSAKSMVLSLLLSWLRCLKRLKVNCEIINMPPKLFDMARVSGLEQVLPIVK